MHRYFFNDETDPVSHSLTQIHSALGDMLGKKIYIYQAIDELSESLDKELEKAR